MSAQPAGLSRFHRVGPFALVGAGIAAVVIAALLRSHRIDRIEVLYFLAFVPTVILHEVSHGVVALACGDDTAKKAKRLTLNPLRHIDPIGSVVLPVILLLSGAPAFGWAKPVPVSVNRLRHPRNQSVLVSLAGPATNIVLATIAGFIAQIWRGPTPGTIVPSGNGNLATFVILFGIVNVIIAVFNLIPIPPLDGSALLERVLPASALPGYYRFRQYALVLVLLVVFLAPGVLDNLLNRAENLWFDIVF